MAVKHYLNQPIIRLSIAPTIIFMLWCCGGHIVTITTLILDFMSRTIIIDKTHLYYIQCNAATMQSFFSNCWKGWKYFLSRIDTLKKSQASCESSQWLWNQYFLKNFISWITQHFNRISISIFSFLQYHLLDVLQFNFLILWCQFTKLCSKTTDIVECFC